MATRSLRGLLKDERALMVCGAFSGLTAQLVERAGFDAVWASSFSIAACKAIPDLNVLSTTDLLHTVSEMLEACALPIIGDCDEGYAASRRNGAGPGPGQGTAPGETGI